MRFLRRAAATALLLGAVAVTTSAAAPTAGTGTLPLLLDFSIAPSVLPAKKPVPARASISWRARTDEQTAVPALEEEELEVGRNLSLDLAGVPVCRSLPHFDIRPPDIEERCREAMVAHGRLGVEVRFPEQQPISVSGKLTLYNLGHKPGGADLLAYTYLPAPVTGALVFRVEVRKIHEGGYGWRARATIPKIAGGSGSITDWSLRLGRRVLRAACPDGKVALRATSSFVDGSVRRETVVRGCSVAEADPRQ